MFDTASLPFPRGEYAELGVTPDTSDPILGNIEGQEYLVPDVDPTTGIARTGRAVRLRCVRNVSGITLAAKRTVSFQATAGLYGARVDGYADTTAEHSYPVDEYLANGVPTNCLFYIVVEGPALCITGITPGAGGNFAVGDLLVSQTAATSQATTAGRVEKQDTTGATTPLAIQIQHRIGRALTAKTTANTAADVLVDVGWW